MREEDSYGWVVVAAAFALMTVGFAAAYSFAAFFHAFESEFGASRGHISLVFSVAAFLWFLLGAPGGMAADRYGPRKVAMIGVAALVIGLWMASRAQSLGVLYASYSVGVGLGVGLVYVPSVGAVQPWFSRHRALASGLAIAGIGAGNIIGPLLAAWCIGAFGWRGAYVALAVFTFIVGAAAALAIRAKPGLAAERASSGMALMEAVRTQPFWLLYASLVLTCIGLFVPMVHLGPYAQDHGYTEAQGVTLVSLIGVGSLVGRFTIGGVADRLGRMGSLVAMYAGLGLMLLVWWSTSQWWLLAVFALVFGTCYGAYVALLPTIVMDLYGARSVSGIIGCLYTGAGVGTLLGPWLAGASYDALGSYNVPILAAAALSFVAALSVAPLIPKKVRLAHRG